MKNLQKLYKNKGFTLVECIVAIAVFAVLTLMVLMIITMAEQTSVNASKSEVDLNNLVQNVVQDDSAKKLGADSRTLNMKFGTKDFNITYSVVDGYKNYVKCTGCGYIGDNLEFMATYIYDNPTTNTYDEDLQKYNDGDPAYTWVKDAKISHWFNQNTMHLKCPKCNTVMIGGNILICESCNTDGKMCDMNGSQNRFLLNKETGSFTCTVCGSGSVKEKGLDKEITSDSKLSVSGMSANAIRYGKVEQEKNDTIRNFITLGSATHNEFQCKIEYKKSDISASLGKYVCTVSSLNLEGADLAHPANMTIVLPGSYIVSIVGNLPTELSGEDGNARISVQHSTAYENPKATSSIYIENLTQAKNGSDFKFEFTLSNYMNNNSFDYDYGDNALQKYWFKANNATIQLPRTETELPKDPVEAEEGGGAGGGGEGGGGEGGGEGAGG